MTNNDKYNKIFMECFAVDKSALNDEFVYQCVSAWDSVGHMSMIAEIEDEFEIIMEIDDIIDFSSYTKGFDTLAKYGIEF
jgi:acyl carrier protein